jgi:hypothetical protein
MGLKPIAICLFVSREGETNETSETGFLINLLIIRQLWNFSETK